MARQSNAAYWAQRFKNMEDALKDQSFSYVENLDRQFAKSIAEIEKQIAAWYQRFAVNNEITLADAKRLLNSTELAEFQWSVQEYIKYGQENALDGRWMKELENASARVHISRLEALKLQIQQQAELLYSNQLDFVDEATRRIYTDSYWHSAFEVQRGLGVGWTMHAINEETITKVLSRPWTTDNQTFRDRCWTNKQSLVNTVNTQLTQMIIRGEAPDRATTAITKQFEVSRKKAGRLVMTESAYFASVAQKDCFADLDVERYEIIAALDRETCDTCGSLDGKVFKMPEYQVGLTAPPFHPWCRCCTAPYFEDMAGLGERFARDAVTGERFKLPSDMKYEDWKAKQDDLHGAGTVDLERKKRYNNAADTEQFERYVRALGNHAPKSFKAFQSLKYETPDRWGFVRLDYSRRRRLQKHPELALPNAESATAPDAKFTKYLFDPNSAKGWPKGVAFTRRLGYSSDNWEKLRAEILYGAQQYPATFKGDNGYGDRYEQKMVLYGVTDTPTNVVVAWLHKADGSTNLTSAYIKEV